MRDRPNESPENELPPCVAEFIARVTKKIRYRRKVRQDVQAELTAHFEDELRGCESPQEREQKARRLIEEFGDAGLLAVLCRRAKKRCRPLWVRALARTMQAMGVFLMVFIPYTIWFVHGKPNPTTDYLPQLNALPHPLGQVEGNAWPYYERAMRLVVEPNETVQYAPWFKSLDPPEESLTSQERRDIADWIAVNTPAWSKFESGTALKYCHRVYRRVPSVPLWFSWDDPPMGRLRRLVQLGLWKSRLAMEEGRIDEALGDCLTLLRGAAHWETNALLLDQLMGHGMTAAAGHEILRTMATAHLSDSQLFGLETSLHLVYQDGYPFVDFDGERLVVLDMIQYCFTHGGPGGGHLATADYFADLHDAIGFPNADASAMPEAVASTVNTVLTMIHASRDKTIAKVDQVNHRLHEIAGLSPYEQRIAGIQDWGKRVGAVEMRRYWLVYNLLPAQRRASEIPFRARADYEALITVTAVKRYWLQKGSYPPDLEILVQDGYLRKVPSDPYSAGPLVYRATDNDFILYSLGPNFTDEGGGPGRDEEGRPKTWRATGDMVFWPVAP